MDELGQRRLGEVEDDESGFSVESLSFPGGEISQESQVGNGEPLQSYRIAQIVIIGDTADIEIRKHARAQLSTNVEHSTKHFPTCPE